MTSINLFFWWQIRINRYLGGWVNSFIHPLALVQHFPWITVSRNVIILVYFPSKRWSLYGICCIFPRNLTLFEWCDTYYSLFMLYIVCLSCFRFHDASWVQLHLDRNNKTKLYNFTIRGERDVITFYLSNNNFQIWMKIVTFFLELLSPMWYVFKVNTTEFGLWKHYYLVIFMNCIQFIYWCLLSIDMLVAFIHIFIS